ncbi:unnamed protein product [Prorocentrum cordatum]|uniref:Right handed beta helix domain-containing protein n=2 Tax=Prorocentrum cordatum TaxID=2364126 RepID=A0ABN9YBS8_9DINO|nr:unnamed protein product [Polarella glacialis]
MAPILLSEAANMDKLPPRASSSFPPSGGRGLQMQSGDDAPVLTDDIIDRIARLTGWRGWLISWSKVASRYRPLDWLRAAGSELDAKIVVVPDDAPRINAGISAAQSIVDNTDAASDLPRVVFVRPGIYNESVRVFADIVLCGLGERGDVTVRSQGWEPALVLGGFTVRSNGNMAAASAGARASVHGLTLSNSNQLQSVSVYCTSGQPRVSHCDIHGTVRVSGSNAKPVITRCRVIGSRSCGIRVCDHASGKVSNCGLIRNRLAAIRVSFCASPVFESNWFDGNGQEGVLVDDKGGFDSDDDICFEEQEELTM